jgi:phospholipid/cholesterol/gamma-HCH transport system substrate-binding protein
VKRSRVRINLVFFGLLFLVLLIEATRSIVTVGQLSHPYPLNAEFTDANGVVTHDEVDYLGVASGEITGVERIPGGVVVHLAIAKDHRIPMGSSAHLDLKSTIGEQYINFVPPAGYHGDHGPYYPAGFTLPAAPDPAQPERGYTTTPVQFADLLRSADRLLASIAPGDLSSLLEELATGINGTTGSLRTLIQSGDRLSSALVTRTAALNQLLTNSTKLVHVVTDHRDSLNQSLLDLSQVAATLQGIQPTTNQLLGTANPLLKTLADLVAAQQGNLDCTLKGLNPLLDLISTPRKLKELTTLLDVGPKAFGGVFDSRDVDTGPSGTGYRGVWLRVGLTLNATNPAVLYNPPKSFPAPATVGTCVSKLKPVSADYRPMKISATFPLLSRTLPRWAGDGVTGICLGLVGLAYLRRRPRRCWWLP